MALESGTYINSLNAANPASTDGLGQADDHIRLIKSAIKATFPNLDGPVTATVANLNNTTAIPSALTDLGISDGSNGMVLSTDGSGNFSFVALPAGTTDTNNYVNGGSFSGTTLTLTRDGLSSISISGFPQAITDNSQIGNGAGYITAASVPTQSTSAGDVGTYAFAGIGTTSISWGGTVSGSSIYPTGTTKGSSSGTNNTPASGTNANGDAWMSSHTSSVSSGGTWRCMGHIATNGNGWSQTVFVRIA